MHFPPSFHSNDSHLSAPHQGECAHENHPPGARSTQSCTVPTGNMRTSAGVSPPSHSLPLLSLSYAPPLTTPLHLSFGSRTRPPPAQASSVDPRPAPCRMAGRRKVIGGRKCPNSKNSIKRQPPTTSIPPRPRFSRRGSFGRGMWPSARRARRPTNPPQRARPHSHGSHRAVNPPPQQ